MRACTHKSDEVLVLVSADLRVAGAPSLSTAQAVSVKAVGKHQQLKFITSLIRRASARSTVRSARKDVRLDRFEQRRQDCGRSPTQSASVDTSRLMPSRAQLSLSAGAFATRAHRLSGPLCLPLLRRGLAEARHSSSAEAFA
jgi:hypothetical protein